MIDREIQTKIQKIKENVDAINLLMAELHEQNVEIRIAYKDSSTGGGSITVPRLDLWRATEHRDYLKERDNEQSTI